MRLLLLFAFLSVAPCQAYFSNRLPGCFNVRGTPVTVLPSPVTAGGAIAAEFWGFPVIAFDPAFIQRLSPVTRDFIYLHECGHHFFGHPIRIQAGERYTMQMEDEADVFAAIQMVRLNYSSWDFAVVEREIGTFLPDEQHRWGFVRAQIVDKSALCTAVLWNIGLLL